MNRDEARVLEQIKSCLRYGDARILYDLNTNTALLNISFSLNGNSPKYRSFVSVVKTKQKIRYHQFCSSSVKRIIRHLMHMLGEGKYKQGKIACA